MDAHLITARERAAVVFRPEIYGADRPLGRSPLRSRDVNSMTVGQTAVAWLCGHKQSPHYSTQLDNGPRRKRLNSAFCGSCGLTRIASSRCSMAWSDRPSSESVNPRKFGLRSSARWNSGPTLCSPSTYRRCFSRISSAMLVRDGRTSSGGPSSSQVSVRRVAEIFGAASWTSKSTTRDSRFCRPCS
jgi:hypothetical protein